MAENARQIQDRVAYNRYYNELLKCGSILDEFDLDLWNALAESLTVATDRMLTFSFRNGTEIPVPVAEKK